MLARLTYSKNIRQTLGYHELKVKKGIAECLFAGNFIKDAASLSKEDKLYHYDRRNNLNDRVTQNTAHISLNFHPADPVTNDSLVAISRDYMRRMDFGEQPYLVYRHYDTVHPHIHIVSGNIRANGERVKTSPEWLGRSLRASDELAKEYKLTHGGSRILKEGQEQRYVEEISGRDRALVPSMSKVLDRVFGEYSFTDLDEFNAVLRLYNMEAYRGKEESFLYQHKGLLYRVLDENKDQTQRYIKASIFDSKPTLKRLEAKFEVGQQLRESRPERITTAVDWALFGKSLDFDHFEEGLRGEGISLSISGDKNRGTRELFYVDHSRKTVYRGEALGQEYGLSSIQQRCIPKETYEAQELRLSQAEEVRHRLIPSF